MTSPGNSDSNNNSNSPRQVCITGRGIVSPLGNNHTDFSSALRAGRSGIRALTGQPEGRTLRVGGVVDIKFEDFLASAKISILDRVSLRGRGATVVHERSASADSTEARHLELAARADVDQRVVGQDVAVVATDATRGLEDHLATSCRRRVDSDRRRSRDAVEPRAESGLLVRGQDATRHARAEHVVHQDGQRGLVAGPVVRSALGDVAALLVTFGANSCITLVAL